MTKQFYAWMAGLCLCLTPIFVQAQCDVVQSHVTTAAGLGYLEINDSSDMQEIDVVTNSTASASYIYMLTNSNFDILEFQDGPTATFDLCPYGPDKYFIWGMSYTGNNLLDVGDLVFTGPFSDGCFLISLTAVVIQKNIIGGNCGPADPCANVLGGTIALQGGATDTTFVLDNLADTVIFSSTTNPLNFNYTYILVDSSGNVVSFLSGDTLTMAGNLAGTNFIYALAYTGNLSLMVGDSISSTTLSDSCFSLSTNFITITQDDTSTVSFKPNLFVSSNTQAFIGAYNIFTDSIGVDSFPSMGADADGIYYNPEDDVLYQLNRTDNVINLYTQVSANLSMGLNPVLTATSTSDFINGREIAVSGDLLVVAQDADSTNNNQNRFVIYQITPNSITYLKTYDANINLWGIDIAGGTLYAVQDNSGNLAVYENFFTQPAGAITPSSIIPVQGIVRTHGLDYNADEDLMLMTDIGSAGSADDGAIVIIDDFTMAIADGMVDSTEQIRIEGDSTFLGNPVDIAYNQDSMNIYVAERANGGGRLLSFNLPDSSGNYAPTYNDLFAGTSALHIGSEDNFNLCDRVFAGMLFLEGGAVDTTVVIDSLTDVLTFVSDIDTTGLGISLAYVVTDASGNIVSFPAADTVDFNAGGAGPFQVYSIVYTGNITAQVGDLINNVDLSDDCFDLSSNFITINTIPDTSAANIVGQFFVSSGTQPLVGVFSAKGNGDIEMDSFTSMAGDADGIFYDNDADVLYQLNRTDNVVNIYSDVNASLALGMTPTLSSSSTADFTNGREIAVNDDFVVVVQDADSSNANTNAFYIYEKTAGGLNFVKSYEPGINLWGIHLDSTKLFAVEDNSNRVVIFEDFFNLTAGPVSPTKVVEVEGITRTHGITYSASTDMMLLTDIGSAADPNDGAFTAISNFTTASSDSIVSMGEQVRVEGPNTTLGNPVDIAYDKDYMKVYIADRANAGGTVLAFDLPTSSGDYTPVFSTAFAGASAIYLSGDGNMFTGGEEENDQLVAPGLSGLFAVNSTLKVFPNPVSSAINLAWEQPEGVTDSEVLIRIVDNQGREFRSHKVSAVEGHNQMYLRIGDLRAGMYHVFITGNGVVRHQRFVKE